MTIKAVVFDCFGVLYVDPAVILMSHCQTKDQAVKLQDLAKALHSGMVDLDTFITEAVKYTDLAKDSIKKVIHKSLVRHDKMFDYAWQLKNKGLKLAVLSSIDKGSIKRLFAEQEISDLFDVIVATGSEAVSKPNPLAYELAINRLGVKPGESIMIDDLNINIEGARLAGLIGVEFRSFSDCYQKVEEIINA